MYIYIYIYLRLDLGLIFVLTGTLDVRKNSSRASSEPSVDACTYTPFSSSFIAFSVCFSSLISSSYGSTRTQ